MSKYQYHLDVPDKGISELYGSLAELEKAIADLGPEFQFSLPNHNTFYGYLHQFGKHAWRAGRFMIYTSLIKAESKDQAIELIADLPKTVYRVTCYNSIANDQIATHMIPASSRTAAKSLFYDLRSDLNPSFTYLLISPTLNKTKTSNSNP